MATGYHIDFPMLNSIINYKSEENQIDLYKQMFSPKLKQPHTLCFIGLINPNASIYPIFEQQARWFVELINGNCKLPSENVMFKDIKRVQQLRKSQFYESPRHTFEIDWIDYMDNLAEKFGAKPKLLKYIFTDPKLAWKIYFRTALSYHYRLEGPHSWVGAREAILNADQRIAFGINHSRSKITSEIVKKNCNFFPIFCSIITIVILGSALNYFYK